LDRAVARAAGGAEVGFPDHIAREQGGVARGDHELVQIAAQPGRRLHAPNRAVAGVRDHVFAHAVAVFDQPLPPREHRATAIALHLEVGRHLARERVLPDRLTVVVDDHRADLADGGVVRRDEDRVGGNPLLAVGDRQ
jgi:hypothetical protein